AFGEFNARAHGTGSCLGCHPRGAPRLLGHFTSRVLGSFAWSVFCFGVHMKPRVAVVWIAPTQPKRYAACVDATMPFLVSPRTGEAKRGSVRRTSRGAWFSLITVHRKAAHSTIGGR